MAYTMRGGDVIEFKTGCKNANQNGLNVLHYAVTSIVGTAPTDAQVAAVLDLVAAPLYTAYLPTVCSYLGSRFQVVFPLPIQVAVITTTNAAAGAQGSSPIAPATTLLLTKRTATAGRVGRGRTYLPFWSENGNDAQGAPSAGSITFGTNWATSMLQPLTFVIGAGTIILTPVLFNKFTGFTKVITSTVVRTNWATQRRRSAINRGDSPFP